MSACRPCYLVFAPHGAGGSASARCQIGSCPSPDFVLSSAQWDALQIPVGVAFFFMNSSLNTSPRSIQAPQAPPSRCCRSIRGIRSSMRIPIWPRLCPTSKRSSFAAGIVDPEAAQAECYLVPIDVCYELVGELRRLWKGFDGGTEAHAALDEFFDRVRTKARPLQTAPEDARR